MFQYVRINEGPRNPNSNVSLFRDPTIIYALFKNGTWHEIDSKNFKTEVPTLVAEQPQLQAQVIEKKFKLSQLEALVKEYNQLEGRKRVVTVRVIDGSTKKAIPDAKISTIGSNAETTTNILGYFQMTIDITDTLLVTHPQYVQSRFKVPDQTKFQIALTATPDK